MDSVADMLDQIQNLPPDDQELIVNALLKNASELGRSEQDSISNVLHDRVNGPFVPYTDEMFERVKERGRMADDVRA